MHWIIITIIAPAFFVAYQTLTKFLPKDTPILLVNAYASLVAAATMFLAHFSLSTSKEFLLNGKAVWLSIGIGALIALGNYSIIKAFSLGAPQSLFVIIFNPLYILYGVLVGVLFWQEKITAFQALGLFIVLCGIFIATYNHN